MTLIAAIPYLEAVPTLSDPNLIIKRTLNLAKLYKNKGYHLWAEEVKNVARLPDLVEGLIPACEPSLFAGAPSAGKTTLMAHLLAQMLQGEVLGHKVKIPPFTGLIVADRPKDDAVAKYRREGLDLPTYSFIDDDSAEAQSATDQLGITSYPAVLELACKYFGKDLVPGSLLIADGLSTITGVEPAGRYLKDVAKPMVKLGRWCIKNYLTVIAIHHASKQKGDAGQRYLRDQDQILGSMALQGFTATQMHLTEPQLNGTNHYRLSIVPHGVPSEIHAFKRRPDGGFEWVEKVGTTPDSFQPAVLLEYSKQIPEDGMQVLDIMAWAHDSFGHERARVYQVLNKLKSQGLLTNPKRGFWARARLQ